MRFSSPRLGFLAGVFPLTATITLLACLATSCGADQPGTDATDLGGQAETTVFCSVDGDCDDGDPCTQDKCLEGGTCTHDAFPGEVCDDGNLCTEDDRCSDKGKCVGTSNVICVDDNFCTADTCDPLHGCAFIPITNGLPCEDGSLCTKIDTCQDGLCVGSSVVQCPDSNMGDCEFPTCNPATGFCDVIVKHPEGYPCKDGDACTDDDRCGLDGGCLSGGAHPCNPQNSCAKAWCNPVAKEGTNPCIFEWKAEGVGCDDNDACTEFDLCQKQSEGSVPMQCVGTAIVCDDGDPCSVDSCKSEVGCTYKPKTEGSPCAENLHWKCLGGECICVPSCTGAECGDDGCSGSCGACPVDANCINGVCTCPFEKCGQICCGPAEVCVGATCCMPECAGKECGGNGCGGLCGECPASNYSCESGQCICKATCAGKDCGSDGCDGSCGACAALQQCSQGQCVCQYVACGDACCTYGSVCNKGVCCAPACTGKQCGSDGCGGSCGSCVGQTTCKDGVCVCPPNCVGKECGDDGCGGSCGACAPLETCDSGQCQCQYSSCGGICCTKGQVCNGASCCSPQCAGKNCGSNNCGGSCGTCTGQAVCQNGQCVCVPNCAGKVCGADGCGGSCGSCTGQDVCQNGSCVCQAACSGKQCGPNGCGGSCGTCSGQSSCVGGQCVCVPVCSGKQCGADGCGGTCGTCGAGLSCTDGSCVPSSIKWAAIPAGQFQMGCSPGDPFCDNWVETPVHTVSIKAFMIMTTEVTQQQYKSVTSSNPGSVPGCSDCPIDNVSKSSADSFCQKIGARLPSEAEWEYAARGNTTNQYGCNACGDPAGVAWYSNNAGGTMYPVAGKSPNAFGLYDMLGNAKEWVADCFHNNYSGAPADGTAWLYGCGVQYKNWIVRGGSAADTVEWVRVSARRSLSPGASARTGFRCAK